MPYVKKAEHERLLEIERKYAEGHAVHDPFADLKVAIDENARQVSAGEVGQVMLHDVCIRFNARKDAFVMETGERIRVQPFELTDSTYKVVDRAMLDRILHETKVDQVEWRAEEEDCEDIARRFVQRCSDLGLNSVGRIFSMSGQHAFCIAIVTVDDGLEVVFLEPQADRIVDPLAGGKYDLGNCFMVIS